MSRTRAGSLSAQGAIVREIRRLHARREPLNISAVKRNHPELIERVYKVRPFWGWKRALEDAGLDYAKINVELRDYVVCKICGRDFASLTFHLIGPHQVSPEDYRLDYPKAEFICETLRANMSKLSLRPIKDLPAHWEKIWTPEYVLDRMTELHRRNHPMNYYSVSEHEARLITHAVRVFGSWGAALRRIGLDPEQIRLGRRRKKSPWWSADNLPLSPSSAAAAPLGSAYPVKQPFKFQAAGHF